MFFYWILQRLAKYIWVMLSEALPIGGIFLQVVFLIHVRRSPVTFLARSSRSRSAVYEMLKPHSHASVAHLSFPSSGSIRVMSIFTTNRPLSRRIQFLFMLWSSKMWPGLTRQNVVTAAVRRRSSRSAVAESIDYWRISPRERHLFNQQLFLASFQFLFSNLYFDSPLKCRPQH